MKIKQLIPCNVEMYAVYRPAEGGECKNKVLAFGIADDDSIYPLEFDSATGLIAAADDLVEYELKKGEEELRKPDKLTRIAQALEDINSNLYDISSSLERIDRNIDECISRNGNNHFLCVTGNICNY